jgi:hypothetical protein
MLQSYVTCIDAVSLLGNQEAELREVIKNPPLRARLKIFLGCAFLDHRPVNRAEKNLSLNLIFFLRGGAMPVFSFVRTCSVGRPK